MYSPPARGLGESRSAEALHRAAGRYKRKRNQSTVYSEMIISRNQQQRNNAQECNLACHTRRSNCLVVLVSPKRRLHLRAALCTILGSIKCRIDVVRFFTAKCHQALKLSRLHRFCQRRKFPLLPAGIKFLRHWVMLIHGSH